jgi:hypothetical protein
MADTTTPNIGLLVADVNDVVQYPAHIGNNLSTIDGMMGAVDCTSLTRPSNTYKGQIIFEHDSGRYVQNTGTKASPTWTYMSQQSYVCTSSARPSLGLTAGMQIFESDTKRFGVYDGSNWQMVMPLQPQVSAVMPGAVAETCFRYSCVNAQLPASGSLYIMSITLTAGQTVGHIGFCTGSQGATSPTHWWAVLLDNTYTQRAHSADQTTTAMPLGTWQKLAMTSAYTATYTGQYYLGIMIDASTMPNILSPGTNPDGQFITGSGAPTPLLNGVVATGQTTPSADGTTFSAPSSFGPMFYMYAAP